MTSGYKKLKLYFCYRGMQVNQVMVCIFLSMGIGFLVYLAITATDTLFITMTIVDIFMVLSLFLVFVIKEYRSRKVYQSADKKLNMDVEVANYTSYWPKGLKIASYKSYWANYYCYRPSVFYTNHSFCICSDQKHFLSYFAIIIKKDYKEIVEMSYHPRWKWIRVKPYYLKIVMESKDGTIVSFDWLCPIVPNINIFIDDFKKWFYSNDDTLETLSENLRNLGKSDEELHLDALKEQCPQVLSTFIGKSLEARGRKYHKKNQTEHAVATIVDIRYTMFGNRELVYEFTTKKGQVMREKGMSKNRLEVRAIGYTVDVYYDPDNPKSFSGANDDDSPSFVGILIKIVWIGAIIALITAFALSVLKL